MEVVAATPNGGGVPPFHDHDVREWSRIDSITGALERARLETDHWSANTINSSHKYGKVVDSRARTDADGALQQQARRQLEVFQSQIPGGHLQVIKTHTVSSSRWTNKTPTISDGGGFGNRDFENLQLPLNTLDLSSQKSKATVGRSATRRPPSRQRPRETPSTSNDLHNPLRSSHLTAASNLHRVSRLCHQIHESAVRQAFGKRSPRPPIRDRQSGDGSVEIYEVESVSSSETKSLNGHSNLSRTKSTSSDDINLIPEKDSSTKSVEDLEDLEQLQSWRRTSKIRRSLQFPKQKQNDK